MEIPKDKQEFIDAYFNEADNPTRKEFEKLTTPEELHYVVLNYSWESRIEVMQWIAESNLCSEATALMIFWLAQPEEYREYNWNAKKLPRYVEIEVFDLIRTVIKNFKEGFYKKTNISYDPKEDMPESNIIPEIILQPTKGEEPYIYRPALHSLVVAGQFNILCSCATCCLPCIKGRQESRTDYLDNGFRIGDINRPCRTFSEIKDKI